MSLSRFYLHPAQWADGGALELAGEEAHHCGRVLRKVPGDEVEIFDGAGRVATARVATVGRERVGVEVTAERRESPAGMRVRLAPAILKGDAFDWLLEKAVELGATSVQPVLTSRVVARPGSGEWERKRARWQRRMLEAAKQCHTPFLPELLPPAEFADLIQTEQPGGWRLLPALTPGVEPLARAMETGPEGGGEALVATGPEGDFTAEEVEAAVGAGFVPVSLGPLILRAETAAIAALSYLRLSSLRA
jgi:16S rRNA (uracil1498-N3)-methyltransferase